MFELILGEWCQLDTDPVIKILICWILIRPKMERIRNPNGAGMVPVDTVLFRKFVWLCQLCYYRYGTVP